MPTVLDGPEAVKAAAGTDLGTSDWLTIDQDRIDRFADATDDHQWIHVDPDRAAAESPFGTTIAHGFLTLSLVSAFLPSIIEVRGFAMGINYGMNKVRFPSPVAVDSRVRAHATLAEVTEVTGGLQVMLDVTIEVEGQDKPACVAQFLARYLG